MGFLSRSLPALLMKKDSGGECNSTVGACPDASSELAAGYHARHEVTMNIGAESVLADVSGGPLSLN